MFLLISIVIPAYNAEKYISYTLDSVLNQTYSDFEVIVIDDCSADKTYEIMEKYAELDDRIRIYKNEKNSGVSFTRNFGVSVSNGDYIAFLDSDDMWTPDKLSKQVELLEKNPDAALLFTGSAFMDYEGNALDHILQVPDKIGYKTLLKQNVISCSSVLVKKSYMEQIKMCNDSMHEDFAVWLKILRKEKYAYGINEPLLIYRLSNNSKSSNKIKAAKMAWRVYRHIGLNIYVSIYYMFHYAVRSILKYSKLKGLNNERG